MLPWYRVRLKRRRELEPKRPAAAKTLARKEMRVTGRRASAGRLSARQIASFFLLLQRAMDDLLALMGEGPDGPPPPPPPAPASAPSSGSRTSEDTSGGTDERRRQQSSSDQAHHVPRSAAPAPRHASSSSVEAAQKKRRQDQSTLDPLTNLRITNRRTSRFDLSDALAPHEFVTTARLAAMSTRDLSRFITQPSNRANDNNGGGFSFGAGPAPSSNANNSFTGGKSNLATMGVLFSNSGSKVSPSTGRAYSIFQLGDLSTGPAVSVFLFGDAYSKHTGNGSYAGKVGSVVAILSPNILPPKRGGATSVSLSVNSADQIVHVGTAQDYGVCSGMIRVRREGRFVDTRCIKFIDKRCGPFCQAHKRQGLQQQVGGGNRMASSTTSSAGLKKNATFLQQFRAEGRSNSAGVPGNNNMASSGQQGILGTGRGGMQSSSNLASALAAAGMDHGTTTGSTGAGNMAAAAPSMSTNAMLQQGGRRSTLNAPRHMVKTSTAGATRNSANAIPRAAVGAAASTKLKRPPLTRAGKDVFGDTMRRGQASGKASSARTSLVPKAKPKERKVATFGGYSGSVQVPKPSRSLFGDAPSSSGMPQHLAGSASIAATPSSNPAEVRERQRQIAEQMRKRKHDGSIGGSSGGGVTNPYLRGAPLKAATSGRVGGSTQGQMDDIFAGLEDLDRADAIAAKSSYQSEADAEQYARSRQAVNDLERKETQKNARDERKKKQMKGRDEKVIQVQWICTTCGRESASQLVLCQTKNHKVKRKRTIKEATTKEESRDKLNKKRAEDGGLQLGSGLEWSGFRGA